MSNMVRPLATSGAYGGNAAAGTVAGIVRHQRTSTMATRTAAAPSVSARLRICPYPPRLRSTIRGRTITRSAFLDPIFFVAAAAVILADGAEGGLEAVEVGDLGERVLGISAKLGEADFDVVHVFPDFGIGRGGAAGLGILGEQRRNLGGRLLKSRKNLARLVEIERRLALHHRRADFGLVAIGLHQRPAGGDRILLGNSGAGPQRDNGYGEHGTEHRLPPLPPGPRGMLRCGLHVKAPMAAAQ